MTRWLASTNITLTATGGYRFGHHARNPLHRALASGSGPFTGAVADLDQTSAIGIPTMLTVPASAEYMIVPLQAAQSYTCVGSTGEGTFSARYYTNGSLLDTIVGGHLGQFAQSIHLQATTGVRFLSNTFSDAPQCTPPPGAAYSVTLAALQF